MNKQEWKNLAENAVEVLFNRIWDDYAWALETKAMKNDRGINDDDFIDEKVEEVVKAYLGISGEQLDKILHGEMK